jgi:hypothetical protein
VWVGQTARPRPLVLRDACELGGNVLGREHEVHGSGGHGAARHRVVARGIILRECDPALGLDGLQAQCAVGGGARENDADGTVALVFCECVEEKINRSMRRSCLGARPEGQHARGDAQTLVRRNDVDVIRLDAQVVGHLVDRERRRASEQLRERAVMRRIEMLHEYDTHARIDRQVLE